MTSFIPNWFDKVGEEEGIDLYFTPYEYTELTVLESRIARMVACRAWTYEMEHDYDSMMRRIDHIYRCAVSRSIST